MVRYRYFIRFGASRYHPLHCVRVPEGDHRIPELIEKYNKIGMDTALSYYSPPSKEEEIHQLRMRVRAWDSEVTIEDLDKKELR
jgi:hypothetical protein